MAYELREGQGNLFKNDSKTKPGANPNWPDYQGDVLLGGITYKISGWKKDGKNGTFLSLNIQPKKAKDSAPPTDQSAPAQAAPDDDEIPF